MNAKIQQRVNLKGELFGARGCSSCSCDPCDCDPCTCGDSITPSYPHWRVSGYSISEGEIDGLSVSNHVLLSLALPTDANDLSGEWHEVLLIDEQAMHAQIQALLNELEPSLHSIPAEIASFPRHNRPVYALPIHYMHEAEMVYVQIAFDPQHARAIRTAMAGETMQAWSYSGPMALRGEFQRH